jgi:glycosyltransferase involved in cell wall biosynthesis
MASGGGPARLRVLHVLLSIGETSAPYNEHCLAMAHRRQLGICTYFPPAVTPPPPIDLFAGDGTLRGFVRALRTALRARTYDIVHVHAPQAALVLLALGPWLASGLLRSTVYTVHNSFGNYRPRNRAMLIPIFGGLRRIVCCSVVARDSLPRLFTRVAGSRLRVVQNGVDVERVDRIVRGLPAAPRRGPFTLVSIGQLIARKNPLAVLRAFAQADDGDGRLVLIGRGPLRDALLAESEAAGVAGRVELTGLVPRDDVYGLLSRGDVFVSASRGEGLPVAVLEAMACARPVILSDIPPHREIATGVDAIPLLAPDDVAGFAREIRRLRAMSVAERAAIGQQCRQVAAERFSVQAMHRGYEQVYAEVCCPADGTPAAGASEPRGAGLRADLEPRAGSPGARASASGFGGRR